MIESNYKLNEYNDNKYCYQLQLLDNNNNNIQHYTNNLFSKLIYKWTNSQRNNKYDDLLFLHDVISEENLANDDLRRLYKLRFIRILIKKITPILNQVTIQPEEVFTMKIIEIRQDNNNNYYNFFPFPFNFDLTCCMIIACCLCIVMGYYIGVSISRSNSMMKTRNTVGYMKEDRRVVSSSSSSILIKYIVWWLMMFYIFIYKNILLRYNITLPFFTVIVYVCYCLCDHYAFYFLLLLSL